MTITLADIIVVAVIGLILCAAIAYIIKAKKSGKKCIGCPVGCSCSAKMAIINALAVREKRIKRRYKVKKAFQKESFFYCVIQPFLI